MKEYLVEWKADGRDYDGWFYSRGTTHTIHYLANGVTYTVRVTARNEHGYGPPSEEATGAPTSGSAVALDTPVLSWPEILHHRMVKLDWQDIEGADSYEVHFYNSSNEWVALPAEGVGVAFDGSSAVVSDLPERGFWWLKVRAVSATGESEWSEIVLIYPTKASDWESESDNSPATGAPTISGTAQVGETLTADTSGISDEDGLDNATFNYQWLADDSDISGAAGSTYTLTDADEGKTVKVRVSFTDDAGNEETLTSAATDAVEAATQPNNPATGAPTISGTAQVGETLTADTSGMSDADGLSNVSYSYQWLADDAAIAGATANTYTLADSDEGKTVTVQVRFTDDAGNDEAVTSGATDTVASKPNSPATGAPTISGTAQVGETLTADTSGITDDDGLENVSFSYQWLGDDAAIASATGSNYTLADSDEGKTVKVQVSFTDNAGHDETLTSGATDAVVAAEPTEPPAAPTNLTAVVNDDGTVTLSWDAPDDDSVTGYQILRRRPQMGEDTLLVYREDTGSMAATFTDTDVTAGVRHVYRVKAINAAGLGKWSNYVRVEP